MSDWRERAACKTAPAGLFFGPEFEHKLAREAREAKAKLICRDCPVVAECLAWAEERNEKHGVWGGLGEDERHLDRRRQRRRNAAALRGGVQGEHYRRSNPWLSANVQSGRMDHAHHHPNRRKLAMALNITEANDVNTLVLWAMGKDNEYGNLASPITDQEATRAAQHLIQKAFRALGAGLHPADVHLSRRVTLEAFARTLPNERPCPACGAEI